MTYSVPCPLATALVIFFTLECRFVKLLTEQSDNIQTAASINLLSDLTLSKASSAFLIHDFS